MKNKPNNPWEQQARRDKLEALIAAMDSLKGHEITLAEASALSVDEIQACVWKCGNKIYGRVTTQLLCDTLKARDEKRERLARSARVRAALLSVEDESALPVGWRAAKHFLEDWGKIQPALSRNVFAKKGGTE